MIKEKTKKVMIKLMFCTFVIFNLTMIHSYVNVSAATQAQNGWVYENGNTYWYENGVLARSKEVYDTNTNAWYWVDSDGVMAKNKDVYIVNGTEGKWVRYDENGKMIKGEDFRYGSWYYFDPSNGKMAHGFANIPDKDDSNGKIAYYDADGKMQYGEQFINGNWYYFDPSNGKMVRGFVNIPDKDDSNGKIVYYDAEGKMQYGEQFINGNWYYFDPSNGKMVRGFVNIPDKDDSNGKTVYYDAEGKMQYGEQSINGNWYYFDPSNGKMVHGEYYHDGKWNYYDVTTGIMQHRSATLQNGESISAGEEIVSENGEYEAIQQEDGNLVVYQNTSSGKEAIWSAGSNGDDYNSYSTIMQGDGNLVVYGDGQGVWSSDTCGADGSSFYLIMQDDGNLVIYNSDSKWIWCSNQGINHDTNNDLGAQVVEYAEQFIGVPYVSHGSTPAGFDCSGFTQYVYNHFGIEVDRNSGAQATDGTAVSRDEMLIGDLVCYAGHVAIYIGNGQIIHSNVPGGSVRIASIDILKIISIRRLW